MEWLILFLVSWGVFLFLVDWKSFKTNLWCGVMAVVLQLTMDTQANHHGFYHVNNPIISFVGSSIPFIMGPIFTIGVLIAQYHPRRSRFRLFNVLVLTLLYSLQELFLLRRGVLVYTGWQYIDSVQVNLAAIVVLSWFAMVILRKDGTGTV